MKKILFIVLVFGIFSCKKEDNNEINNIRPTKIIQLVDGENYTTYYTYDGSNPNTIESDDQLTVFEYQSNKLLKQKVYRKGDEIPWIYLSYEYNSNNKIIKVGYNINVNSTVENWIGEKIDSYKLSAYYGYDYDGNKLIMEYYYDNYSKDTTSYTYIDYDSENNIITKTRYSYYVNQYVKDRLYKYEYDTKPHYLRNVNYPAYGSIFSIINNILTEEITDYHYTWDIQSGILLNDSTTTKKEIIYEYNENYYPISIVDEDVTMKIEYN